MINIIIIIIFMFQFFLSTKYDAKIGFILLNRLSAKLATSTFWHEGGIQIPQGKKKR